MNVERMRWQYRNGELADLPNWFIKEMDEEMAHMEKVDASESTMIEKDIEELKRKEAATRVTELAGRTYPIRGCARGHSNGRN